MKERRFISSRIKVDFRRQKGLTLLELIVVTAILGILMVTAIGFLNPASQLSKAADIERRNDLVEINNSLNAYYNDTSCYPETIPFGSEWKVGNTVYMRQVPEDPSCSSNDTSCYVYAASGSCSQWNVVFAKLTNPPAQGSSCSLSGQTSCVPTNFSSEWACAVSGSVDCAAISSVVLPVDPLEDGTGITITPTPTANPTPTGCPVAERNYGCTGSPPRCNALPVGSGTYCSVNCDGVC